MSGSFPLPAFAANVALSATALAVFMAGAFVVGRRLGRHAVVDVAWGASFAAVALLSTLLSTGMGDPLRTGVLCALTTVWGVRLSAHIAHRDRGKGEDPRYDALLSRAPGGRDAYAARVVYLLQGFLVLLVSAPIQVGVYSTTPAGWATVAGGCLWALGMVFESVGDLQLARFKADPANRGRVMTRGLWAWTRHPNYFGDACVWWGLFLVSAEGWPGVLTVPAPVLMTWLLTRGSGQRLLDARMRDRPGWAEYAARTPAFLPFPPGWRKLRRT